MRLPERKWTFFSKLKDEEMDVVTRKEDMNRMVMDYFHIVFNDYNWSNSGDYGIAARVITDEQNKELVAEISFQEFTAVAQQMHPDKASGPDGLNPAFFNSSGRAQEKMCMTHARFGSIIVCFLLA